jgi:hypothetical protein
MSHKDKHKKLIRAIKKRAKKRVKRATAKESVYRTLYEEVFEYEIKPYESALNKYSERVDIKAWRVTENPANISDFISKREISILEHANDPDYLDIQPVPKDGKKKSMLKFFGEYGLSSFESEEECEKYMIALYERIAHNHGLDAANDFFENHGRYMVQVTYRKEDGWKLPTNKFGHFDFIRDPEWDYRKSLTDNYKDLNIKWHKIQ